MWGDYIEEFNSREELLKYACNIGIIKPSKIADDVESMEREKILNNHPYEIWSASDGRVKTYLADETKKNGRRLIAKRSINEIEDEIVKNYNKNVKERYKIYQLFDDWMRFAREEEALSLSTISRYSNDYDRFFKGTEFVKYNILSITEMDVIKFLKTLVRTRKGEDKITRKCFTNIKIVLNGIFSYARTEREIECIVVSDALKNFKMADHYFKYTIKKDSEEVFNDEEVVIMINHIINLYTQMRCKRTRELGVLFTLLTGIRVGELVTLKNSDEENGKLYIQRTESKGKDEKGKSFIYIKDYPKTIESMSGIELTESAIEVWNLIKKLNYVNGTKSDFVFYEEGYGRLHEYHFKNAIKKICRECNIPFRSMHKLRKTYSSTLFAKGVEEKIVQQQMRHKDSKTTHKHYEFSIRNREYKREQLNNADIIQSDILKRRLQSKVV